jgi:hypoxanthine phosphoribosyltransferase
MSDPTTASRVDAQAAKRVYAEADRLLDAEQLEAALDRMAEAITARLADTDPLLLCVLSGAVIPLGKLLPRLEFPLKIDCLHATRYGDATSGGQLQWLLQPRTSLRGRTVLVVDDILDEGITLAAILSYCKVQGASAVYSAVLVRKRRARAVEVEVDFVGLDVEDRYVFGYGMDYHGYWRNAPGLFAVKGM